MKLENTVELLEVLGCDIGARPAGAASVEDIEAFRMSVTGGDGEISVAFLPAALPLLREFVAAEQLCCAGLGWQLDEHDTVLTISASPAQLDELELLFG